MSTDSNPLIDAAKALHEHFQKFISMIPTPGYTPKEEPEQHADAGMVSEANDSFKAAAAKMKGQANAYDSTQKQPLKTYSK